MTLLASNDTCHDVDEVCHDVVASNDTCHDVDDVCHDVTCL